VADALDGAASIRQYRRHQKQLSLENPALECRGSTAEQLLAAIELGGADQGQERFLRFLLDP